MKLAFIVGTRPEIIKMSPIIKQCSKKNIPYDIIHTNQHYTKELDSIFFQELELTLPKYHLNIGSKSPAKQIGNMITKLEEALIDCSPTITLVQGDTNTVLSGALTSNKLGIPIAHIEAGLRSYDREMPEETNRIITDHISEYLFSVTEIQKQNLINEGINPSKIFTVGNTIVDAVESNKLLSFQKSQILNKLNLVPKQYYLFTSHRASNVDSEESLNHLVNIIAECDEVVCWPIHPRSKAAIEKLNITLPSNLVLIDPVGYLDFLCLETNSKKIITDSGGVQEEACILGIPCITIRENTERPETLNVGANLIVGLNLEKFRKALKHTYPTTWKNPFGNGNSAEQIISTIC